MLPHLKVEKLRISLPPGQANLPDGYLRYGEIVSTNANLGGLGLDGVARVCRCRPACSTLRARRPRSASPNNSPNCSNDCGNWTALATRLAAGPPKGWKTGYSPQMTSLLAEQFQQLMVQPELSLEVRWRISMWQKQLPPARLEPPESVSAEELRAPRSPVGRRFLFRAHGGCERLKWMAAGEHLAKPIALVLTRRLADPSLSEESYRRLEAIHEIAWGTWLAGDAPAWDLPPVSDIQIDNWLDELRGPWRSVTSARPYVAALHAGS